jgi:hypothetical protein
VGAAPRSKSACLVAMALPPPAPPSAATWLLLDCPNEVGPRDARSRHAQQVPHVWLVEYYVNNSIPRAREGKGMVALMGQLQRVLHAIFFKKPTPYIQSLATFCAETALDAVDDGLSYNLRADAKVVQSVLTTDY